jgi:UDP-N-acetylglucosamine diphosphorylase/glucosamine-1-phosphate N-acetyltransferase
VGSHPLHLHATAVIGVGVVFDTSAGPVCVGPGGQVGHHSVVQGPAWIGPKSIVAPGALLKERTVLGPQCRAAGEIGSAIFQACSNKAHDGHLGDALLGEWVNLGAGTVNSNLLNTYGEVAMRLRPGASMERTGRQFMGCVIGDHAKTAIGTRIMTGSSIGTGAMWAAGRAVSGAVAPFAWVTDDGERRFRLDKFQEIARTVMARRGAEPGPATAARLAALHAAAGG